MLQLSERETELTGKGAVQNKKRKKERKDNNKKNLHKTREVKLTDAQQFGLGAVTDTALRSPASRRKEENSQGSVTKLGIYGVKMQPQQCELIQQEP